jgi:hypothetical protein
VVAEPSLASAMFGKLPKAMQLPSLGWWSRSAARRDNMNTTKTAAFCERISVSCSGREINPFV